MIVGLVHQEVLGGGRAIRAGVFNTVSMMTTTGFANADFALWTSLTSLVLFGLTLLGASAGSTSGSIKLIRHVVIAKMLRREIDQTLHPGVVVPLRVNGAVVDERALRAIIVFVFLYLGVWAAGAISILFDSALQDVDLTAFQALADSASMIGGVGPGLGFAGPMGSYRAVQQRQHRGADAADVLRTARDHPGAGAVYRQPLARVTVRSPSRTDTAGHSRRRRR